MEEMKSLGSIQLFSRSNKIYILTEETGELLVSTFLEKVIFKMRWKDIEFALPINENNDWVGIHANGVSRYFRLDILKYYMNLFTSNV